jgi:hypothetical protein
LLPSLSTSTDFFLPGLDALAAVVIELCAGFQNKCFLLGIKSAFAFVVAAVAKRIPILALFDTFQIAIAIGGFFKEAFFGKIIPVLTIMQGYGLARRPGLAPFAGHGKIPVAVNLSFFEPHLSGHDCARKGNKENCQQEQQAQFHLRLL